MAESYWEDRLTKDQVTAINQSIRDFKLTRMDSQARDILYDKLCNFGMTSEEADEMSSL